MSTGEVRSSNYSNIFQFGREFYHFVVEHHFYLHCHPPPPFLLPIHTLLLLHSTLLLVLLPIKGMTGMGAARAKYKSYESSYTTNSQDGLSFVNTISMLLLFKIRVKSRYHKVSPYTTRRMYAWDFTVFDG